MLTAGGETLVGKGDVGSPQDFRRRKVTAGKAVEEPQDQRDRPA